MADNDKRIAEIDSQLAKAMVENNSALLESIATKSNPANFTISRTLAPSDGTVFDLYNLITQVLSRLPILLFSKLFLMTL